MPRCGRGTTSTPAPSPSSTSPTTLDKVAGNMLRICSARPADGPGGGEGRRTRSARRIVDMTDVIEQVSAASERWDSPERCVFPECRVSLACRVFPECRVFRAHWVYRVRSAHPAGWACRAQSIYRGRWGGCSPAGLSAGLSGGSPAGPPGPSTSSVAPLGVSLVSLFPICFTSRRPVFGGRSHVFFCRHRVCDGLHRRSSCSPPVDGQRIHRPQLRVSGWVR